ncbi:MAG: DEAD/DEAH box helicase [Kiritimatiellae bacterium]|nr:DEAD/DEAH box helicase [Kiritimatiellia bacterium]
MTLIHAEISDNGEFFFRAEARNVDDDVGVPLCGSALLVALGGVLARPGDATPDGEERVSPGWRNLLLFLSDVRGRKFSLGVFLAPEVLAAADDFRLAAKIVSSGLMVPTLSREKEAYRATWRSLVEGSPFLLRCVDALARRAGRTPLETGGRHETAEDAWLAALRADDAEVRWGKPATSPAEEERRAADLADLETRLADWCAPLAVSSAERAALCFALMPPPTAEGAWRLTYRTPETRLGFVALGQAIRLFPPLAAEVFRKEDAEAFLRTGAALLVGAGFSVDIPPGIVGEHVTAEADLHCESAERPLTTTQAARPIRTKLTIRVAGEVVSEAEIAFLLEQNSPIVFFRDRWIEVDRSILKEALRALRDAKGKRLSMHEAVAFLTGARRLGSLKIAEARAHGWLRGLVNELKGGEGFKVLPPPEGFRGELRDYQLRGYSWLDFLAHWGFGPCLADDMGLGKTVQTIAWVLRHVQGRSLRGPVLIVAPVSVTTNWMREFAKFAPGLKVQLHQGPARATGGSFAVACRRADVVITGYSLLVHDFRDFRGTSFAALILDEAQMVKNPDTRVARAARAIDAPVRMALTGTPLENSVADLWSLEEFLNPGLLGARRDFADTFGRDLARGADPSASAAAAKKLRHALAPFMLRRLKSDPGVANELGAKHEVREYCVLSPDQRRDYEDALRRFRDEANDPAQRASRSGRVLGLLTELKQICDGAGKIERLDALLEEIFAAGESALLFTQYVRVARLLRDHLAEVHGRRFPFLHGGLSTAQREAEIAAFNADPEPNVFLVSLKAGGFGLNLTRATHVIHFDRWWNPAVENQATDRAHRIGQSRTVFVHLFISSGTLEDRIDALLEDKRRLAGEIVGSGEAFLTKMSEREFERMVALA